MHETGLVGDLLARAEAESGGDVRTIESLRIRIGALSGLTADGLRATTGRVAVARWGFMPELEIEQSDDPTDPNAMGVVLVALRMEV